MNFGFYTFTKKITNKFTVFALVLMAATVSAFSQNAAVKPPRQEKLLNGLKVLMWSDPSAPNVSVKIRIHAGSAFDPQDKEGLMQMLAENIFPNEIVKEYFTDDLGGSLEVVTNYDYIQINATSKSESFLDLLQTLSNAVANPAIDKETTAKLKAKQLEKIAELEKNQSYVADQAAAEKLLGTFPYGRRQAGTPASIQKIDFADLLLAKQRFLSADNATVTIAGNFKTDLAFRAARRYFGAWLKSDKLTPSTFRQPDAPELKTKIVNFPNSETVEFRSASRGLARNDKDYGALLIALPILQENWLAIQPDYSKSKAFTRHQTNILPGVFLIGASVPLAESDAFAKKMSGSVKPGDSITNELFEKYKTRIIGELNAQTSNVEGVSNLWLDADTYKTAPISEQLKSLQNVTVADVKRVTDNLFDGKNRVTILVGNIALETTSETKPNN